MRNSVEDKEAIKLLKDEHSEIQALINSLTNEQMTRHDTIRYGLYSDQKLSFKDLLAHLVCYEVYALAVYDAWKQGKKHPILDTFSTSTGRAQVHYNGIAERAGYSLAEMLTHVHQTHIALEAVMENITSAEWISTAPFPTDKPTNLGGVFEAILVMPPRPMYRHLPVHIPDTEAYIQSLD